MCDGPAGERLAVFVGPVPEDKLPKDAAPGRVLTGKLVVAKLPKSAGGGDAPGAVPFTYTCSPACFTVAWRPNMCDAVRAAE